LPNRAVKAITGQSKSLSGQRPDSYQPRATPWVPMPFYSVAGQSRFRIGTSYGPITPRGHRQPTVAAGHESRFQRSGCSSADKPRALPWAGMKDAVGVTSRPVARSRCCPSGSSPPRPEGQLIRPLKRCGRRQVLKRWSILKPPSGTKLTTLAAAPSDFGFPLAFGFRISRSACHTHAR
jgi:hypothetical protein